MQVNSSLIAHLAKELSSSKVDVQVVSIPDRIDPPLDSELLRCTNSAFTCFGNKQELFSQLVAGYRYLHENWKVEAMEETRDPVYFFGDEEGALVANALAHMIIRAGVLDRKWGRIFDDAFKDAFRIAAFDKDEEAQVFIPYNTQILIGVVNFVCTFLGLYAFERFGRRIPLIIGGVWQSLWLFVFAAAGTAKEPSEDKAIGKLMIVSSCLFFLGMASTWAPGTWIVISEYCPTHSRAKQGALSTASNWLFNFLLAFFTPMIVSALDFRYGFIFAACNLTGAIAVYFFVYESAGMSLENVDLMYRDARTTPWTSRTWVPPTSEQTGCDISGVNSKEIEEGH
ncbi:hypothetical protein ACEPAI_1323 [Sanghuangporus weigelae]